MKHEFIPFGLILILLLGSSCATTSSTTAGNRFNVPALTDWHKENGIKVPDAVSTSIIRLSNAQYRIFYPGGEGIASSVSSDGLLFTAEAGTRVSKGSSSDYDAKGAKDPDMVVEGSYYQMYYTANWFRR